MNGPQFENDDEALGRLLAALPPPPKGWIKAAASLPQTRRDAEQIVALAEADEKFRAATIADPQAALREAGYEPTPPLLAEIRARLEDG